MSRRGPLIAAGASLLAAVLVVVALLLPRASAVNKKEKELTQAQQQQGQLEAQLQQLKQARRDARKVQRQLAHLETRIPPTADLPALIRFLQNAADAAAVDFVSISPGQPANTPGQQISTIPTQVEVEGTFFSVEEFLFKLETLPRAVKVTQIQVGPGTQGLPQLQISMTSEVYTTDASAGPGSQPGSNEAQQVAVTNPSATPATPGG
jgi:Tfp pilus assembly protein PilO